MFQGHLVQDRDGSPVLSNGRVDDGLRGLGVRSAHRCLGNQSPQVWRSDLHIGGCLTSSAQEIKRCGAVQQKCSGQMEQADPARVGHLPISGRHAHPRLPHHHQLQGQGQHCGSGHHGDKVPLHLQQRVTLALKVKVKIAVSGSIATVHSPVAMATADLFLPLGEGKGQLHALFLTLLIRSWFNFIPR